MTRTARQAAASAATPNLTSTRRCAMTRAIKSLIRIRELPQLLSRLKSEKKSFRSRNMLHLMSIFCVNDLVAQFQPGTQLLRRALDRARPATAGERPLDFGKACVLAKNEQRHPRPFR